MMPKKVTGVHALNAIAVLLQACKNLLKIDDREQCLYCKQPIEHGELRQTVGIALNHVHLKCKENEEEKWRNSLGRKI